MAQLDDPILRRLGAILVTFHHARFRYADGPSDQINVGNLESNLLRGTQTAEESELIVVALRLAPIGVDARDDFLRLLDAERIGRAPILLRQAEALERSGRVMAFRGISITEIKGTSKRTDDVVTSLLAAVLLAINDSEERGVFDAVETLLTDLGSPYAVEYLPVAFARRERHVVLRDSCLTVSQEIIEHLIAGAPSLRLLDVRDVAIGWKLLRELERARLDPFLDPLQLHACAAQVCLARRALDLRTIARALKLEVELDSIRAFRAYAAA